MSRADPGLASGHRLPAAPPPPRPTPRSGAPPGCTRRWAPTCTYSSSGRRWPRCWRTRTRCCPAACGQSAARGCSGWARCGRRSGRGRRTAPACTRPPSRCVRRPAAALACMGRCQLDGWGWLAGLAGLGLAGPHTGMPAWVCVGSGAAARLIGAAGSTYRPQGKPLPRLAADTSSLPRTGCTCCLQLQLMDKRFGGELTDDDVLGVPDDDEEGEEEEEEEEEEGQQKQPKGKQQGGSGSGSRGRPRQPTSSSTAAAAGGAGQPSKAPPPVVIGPLGALEMLGGGTGAAAGGPSSNAAAGIASLHASVPQQCLHWLARQPDAVTGGRPLDCPRCRCCCSPQAQPPPWRRPAPVAAWGRCAAARPAAARTA
jgi:hypothetical protein